MAKVARSKSSKITATTSSKISTKTPTEDKVGKGKIEKDAPASASKSKSAAGSKTSAKAIAASSGSAKTTTKAVKTTKSAKAAVASPTSTISVKPAAGAKAEKAAKAGKNTDTAAPKVAVKVEKPAKAAAKKSSKAKAVKDAGHIVEKNTNTPPPRPVESASPLTKVNSILVTQPRPETEKSPYFDLARKYNLKLEFHPFIRVEGVAGKDFRKQRVDIAEHTAIVFTSRYAVDHFFRICEELKVKVSQDMKYVCITEAVALYLQKFILYRKRKVFFSPDGSIKGMLDIITKHKHEKYLLPTTDSGRDAFIQHFTKLNAPYAEVTMYRTVANDIETVMKGSFDMILFFSPFSVQTLFANNPSFRQNGTLIGAFGPSTTKAVEDAGLRLDVKAPAVNAPSMVSAIELYLSKGKK